MFVYSMIGANNQKKFTLSKRKQLENYFRWSSVAFGSSGLFLFQKKQETEISFSLSFSE